MKEQQEHKWKSGEKKWKSGKIFFFIELEILIYKTETLLA